MKNTGRFIAVIFALISAAGAYAADITVSAGRNVISPGESTELVITVNGSSVDIDRTVVPRVDGLSIRYGGSGSSFQYMNGKSSSSTTLTFHVSGEKEGDYTIPPFTVSAGGAQLQTRPVNITVKKGAGGVPTGRSINVACDIELSFYSFYSGQPVILRYFIYHPAGAEISIKRIMKQPVSEGFIVKELNEEIPPEETVKKGLNLVKEHVVTYCLIPEITGSRATGGGSMLVAARDSRRFFSRPVQGELVFPEKKLAVMQVPGSGRPAGYSGDVGGFKLEAEDRSGSCMVNQEIQIPVTVTGRGNFFVMSKPAFENTEGIKVLVEESEPELVLAGNEITGTKKFLVTVIPQTEGAFKPGPLALKYFNPATRAFETAASVPLSIEVKGTALPPPDKTVKEDNAESTLPLLAYAGAGALAAVSVIGLAFIIYRERRRYAGLKAENKKEADAPGEARVDPVMMLRGELELALGSAGLTGRGPEGLTSTGPAGPGGNGHAGSDKLMKLCLRAADLLTERSGGKSNPELAAVKSRLDAARYANASLSEGELEDACRVLMALMK